MYNLDFEGSFMQIGFYAGSFDPFTNGHLNVILKASKLFDKVIIGIGINPNKKRRFDRNIMKKAIEKTLENKKLNNVIVICYDNLSIDIAKANNSTFLIRGIRDGIDYNYEENLASINEELSGLDTIYIRAGSFGNISSSMVMELIRNNRDVSKYVPKEILNIIKL